MASLPLGNSRSSNISITSVSGQTQPSFPGGLVSNRSLNGTPEFAYGLADWWEVGLYLPFAVQDGRFVSDAAKLRTLFVVPNANEKTFFYGLNFEFSNSTPKFSQTRFGMEDQANHWPAAGRLGVHR